MRARRIWPTTCPCDRLQAGLVRRLQNAVGMTVREFLDATGQGAMLALAIRWLFHLNIDLHWAACIGALSLLLQPWLNLQFCPLVTSHGVPDLLIGGAVAAALLGVAQLISDH